MCQKKYEKDLTVRSKVDRYLKLMAAATAAMGIDSTKSDHIKYKKKIYYYHKQIEVLDEAFYKTINP
jgi:hypothetical protein